MVPGRVTYPLNQSTIDETQAGVSKNRIYFSSDYDNFTGEPSDKRDRLTGGPSWPLWDTNPADTLKVNRYFGYYVDDLTQRNRATYSKGPAVISQEDIFSTYKDTDLGRYEIGKGLAQRQGYPLGIQVEQTIYSWGFGQYKDFIFLKYDIINRSSDTLFDCVMAPAMDMDLGAPANDHTSIAIPNKADDTLNLGVQWSETTGEGSKVFGYVGMDFLESPAVDGQNFIRKDKRAYEQHEQLGLRTFRNWIIDIDPKTPEERYDFMARVQRDVDNGGGDKRFLMSTGVFNMRPGDTARVVCAILCAYGYDPQQPTKTIVGATGAWDNMKRLIELDTFAQYVYDNNFRAPRPPEPCNVQWTPLNEGVKLSWDNGSEVSLDLLERGLDFAGYVIQRTRKPVENYSPTTSDSITGWNLGWKTIGRIELPLLPDSAIRNSVWIRTHLQGETSLAGLGPWWRLPMLMDVDTTQGNLVLDGRRIGATRTIINRVDTLRRPGFPDSLIQTNRPFDTLMTYHLRFDPYDDKNDDSTLFNNTEWGNQAVWGDRFRNKAIRDIVRNAIQEVMDSLTNGKTFIDVGDDNGDGQVISNQEKLNDNERLVNNTDYYYRVLAFDEGSTLEGTPSKLNTGIDGINEVRTTPEAPAAGPLTTPVVVSSNGLAGIRNVRFLTYDEQRLGQLFGGDTLEFEFQPTDLRKALFYNLWYATEVTVRSKRTGNVVQQFYLDYDRNFSDRADSARPNLDTTFVTRHDSIFVNNGVFDHIEFYDKRNVKSVFNATHIPSAQRPHYGTVGIYAGTFGLAFDYTFIQFGDSLRFGRFGDTASTLRPATITTPGPNVNIVARKQYLGNTFYTDSAGRAVNTYSPLPNIGQIKLEVEFVPGGTERLTYTKAGKTFAADVPYLNLRVKNVASYDRELIDETGAKKSEAIQYNYEFQPDPNMSIYLDTALNFNAATLQVGKYGLTTFGWIDVGGVALDQRVSQTRRLNFSTGNVPMTEGSRYYVGPVTFTQEGGSETHVITFGQVLMVNGAEIVLDAAGMGNSIAQLNATLKQLVPQDQPTTDFKVGDKFTVDFTGGAIGLPQPGAKVLVAVPSVAPALDQYTDDMLEKIKVVPNPYLISHIGQRANSDRQLYFTHLPEECKIEIYTSAGELLQTINHKASDSSGKVAVNAWDLVSNGNRQVQSQLLIARITTPNGAETIKKFSVVVGGFRIVGN
ncbi:MAG: Fibronectin type III domain protein [Chlorobi bacterium OLB7]|nr:MAG: Fibronectin type III domain protein [Chlorobi bacterium OLB7]